MPQLIIAQANKDDTSWYYSGQALPERVAAMLHGKRIRKFETTTDSYQNITCIMTFHGGDTLHIEGGNCVVAYHQVGKM